MHLLNDYKETKDCFYKGEHYSVRDNGAVLRHSREGKRIRRDDDTWTFGKANEQTGYMEIGHERVHRIVAYAFLGEPPTPQHIVDHIDTNRRNNRPQNLRWLTKLENALNNPITKKKIEYLCGSIEAFIDDPSMIQEFADSNPNFSWMRTVTIEEAKASYERLCSWAKTDSKTGNIGNGALGEWIYTPFKENRHKYSKPILNDTAINNQADVPFTMEKTNLTESLTQNAMQKYWRTPTEFPLCPIQCDTEPLVTYWKMLKKGAVVTKNKYSVYFIDEFAICNDKALVIRVHSNDGLKRYALVTVTFEEEKFIHECQTFFEERGAQKAFTLAKGLEWDGEDGIDDYC